MELLTQRRLRITRIFRPPTRNHRTRSGQDPFSACPKRWKIHLCGNPPAPSSNAVSSLSRIEDSGRTTFHSRPLLLHFSSGQGVHRFPRLSKNCQRRNGTISPIRTKVRSIGGCSPRKPSPRSSETNRSWLQSNGSNWMPSPGYSMLKRNYG